MQPRTRRQKEVFDYIRQYMERNGCKPSYQMIARHLGVTSKAGIARHIESLEKQGLISRRRENGSFGLDLPLEDSTAEFVCEIQWLDVPQIETSTNEDWRKEPLFVPRFILGLQEPERLRAFLVPNDAMSGKHICEGDVALIDTRPYARDGDVVVAIVGNKRVVMKQFFRYGSNFELRPANEFYETIKLPAHKIKIVGVHRGLFRPIS
jgi:repressor LexA